MVILGLLAESKAYRMFDAFKPLGIVADTFTITKSKYLLQIEMCNGTALLLIVLGGHNLGVW